MYVVPVFPKTSWYGCAYLHAGAPVKQESLKANQLSAAESTDAPFLSHGSDTGDERVSIKYKELPLKLISLLKK